MSKEIEQDAWRLSDDVMDLLDDKAIDFIFSQGEKYLEELCKVSDSITGRCYTLLGIIFAICPFLVTTVLSVGEFLFSVVAYLFAVVCIGVCIMLLLTMKPRDGYSKGRDPKELTYGPFMEHYKENKISSYALYELENLQWKIDVTGKANNQRSRTFTIALWTLLVGFCLLLVFTMIFTSC
jgi:FtsH-binding integral membrane protein